MSQWLAHTFADPQISRTDKIVCAAKTSVLCAMLEDHLVKLGVNADNLLEFIRQLEFHAATFIEEKTDEDQILSPEARRPQVAWQHMAIHRLDFEPPTLNREVAGFVDNVSKEAARLTEDKGHCACALFIHKVDQIIEMLMDLGTLLCWPAATLYGVCLTKITLGDV